MARTNPFASLSSLKNLYRSLALVGLVAAAPPIVSLARADGGAASFPGGFEDQAGWQAYKAKHGISVERRPVAGSKFFEYRAKVSTPVAPERIIEQLWRGVTKATAPVLKKRQILREEPAEIVIYDQIKTPVVSDRDYTLRVRKLSDPGGHRYKMTFETANELGPPVDPKHVRIPAIRGAWSVEPDDKGGSRLTYQTFSEPGGSIPSFMIHGAQFDQCVQDVERVQEMLKKL